MNILVACEYSGVVRDAFIAKGHNAVSCDLLPTLSPGPHIQGSVLDHLSDGWDLMVAHPPCTRLSNSGVRWLKERNLWSELDDAIAFYNLLRDAPILKKCIENPVMHCHAKNILGQMNRQLVHPWWFGEKTFKATGFELIGLPYLFPTDKLICPLPGTAEHKIWSWVHRCPPGPDRWKIRSTTSFGVASAMASQWF
jgi:hypothetical protein